MQEEDQADLPHTSSAGEGTVPHPPSPQDGHHHGADGVKMAFPDPQSLRKIQMRPVVLEAAHGDGKEKGVLLLIC